jgi:hypothetical protein
MIRKRAEGGSNMSTSKFDTHVLPYLDKIVVWAKEGATTKAIANNLGIAYSTFRKYVDEGQNGNEYYSALSAAFVRAREVPDNDVENSLNKRALGYNAKVVKHYKVKETIFEPDTGKKVSEVEKLVECFDEVHVPADTNAIIFWLTNRRQDRWKRDPLPDAGNGSATPGIVKFEGVLDEWSK